MSEAVAPLRNAANVLTAVAAFVEQHPELAGLVFQLIQAIAARSAPASK